MNPTRRKAKMMAGARKGGQKSGGLHVTCPSCLTKLEGGLSEALHHNKLHRHWSVGQ